MADSVRSGQSRSTATPTNSPSLVSRVGAKINPKIAATPVGTGVSGPLLPLPPSRPPARGRVVNEPIGSTAPLVGLLGVAAFLTLPLALTLLSADGATHAAADTLAGYSPERLVHGAIWTLPLSALLLPHVRMIGPTTIFTIAFLLPYALLRGPVRALVVFFAGHVVATLCIAVIAIGGHVVGWSTLDVIYRHLDVGAATGLAAVVGALAGVLLIRSRLVGIVVLAGVVAYLVAQLLASRGPVGASTDVQQLLGLATGLMVEWRWSRS